MFKRIVRKWFSEWMTEKEKYESTIAGTPLVKEERERALRREVGRAVEAAFSGEIDTPMYGMFFGTDYGGTDYGKISTVFTSALDTAVIRELHKQTGEITKQLVTSHINSEEFIDRVVDRINRKQLRPGE